MDDKSEFKQYASNSLKNKNERLLLSIDPGKDKCGIAILNYQFKVLSRCIVKTIDIKSYLKEVFNNYSIKDIVLGNGTYSRELAEIIKGLADITVNLVDEAYTTVEAEERYLAKDKKFWQSCLSFIRWKPSAAVDDYVAIILAERFIKNNYDENEAE